MDTRRLQELAGVPITESVSPLNEFGDALRVMTDHMHQIKRALEAGNPKAAMTLVDGAIKAFSQRSNKEA